MIIYYIHLTTNIYKISNYMQIFKKYENKNWENTLEVICFMVHVSVYLHM